MALTSLLSRLGVRHRDHLSVARDFSIYSAVNVVSLVLMLGTWLVVRRYLGPYLAGVWTALEVLPAYAAYAHLGILNAAERELPFLLGARRDQEFERLKHTLFWLSHGLGLGLAAALTVSAFVLASRVDRPMFVGLLVYAPLLWTQIIATYYVVLYRSRQRFVALSGRQGVANLIKAVGTMACGYAFGLYGVFGALLVGSVAQVALFHTGLGERFERTFEWARIRPLLVAGLPMLAGAVAFETIRNADRIVIGSVLGLQTLGVYSVTPIICQGVYYFPNALSTVMYPRFQQRYGATQSVASLRRFVELPLRVLADGLLAVTAVLIVALPPLVTTFLPEFAAIAPLRVMLVSTYFLCLAPPAGQFLLTVHKQTPALLIALPATGIALAAAYAGAGYGLVGVAYGIGAACVFQFVGLNAYAFTHFSRSSETMIRLLDIAGTALVVLLLVAAIERFVPAGPAAIAVVGGWRLVAVAAVAAPLLTRAARRLRSIGSVDIAVPPH